MWSHVIPLLIKPLSHRARHSRFRPSLIPSSFFLFLSPYFSWFFAWCSAWCFLPQSAINLTQDANKRSRSRKWLKNLGFEESSSPRGGSPSTSSSTAYTSSSSRMVGTPRHVDIYHHFFLETHQKQVTNARLAGLNTLKWSVWTSRGAGLVLAFDGGLILVPMLRNVLRFVRPKLNWLFPADENIWFHRQVAYSMAFWAMVHTTAHYVNFINVERTRTFFVFDNLRVFLLPDTRYRDP